MPLRALRTVIVDDMLDPEARKGLFVEIDGPVEVAY
jgi:hypothetical protein